METEMKSKSSEIENMKLELCREREKSEYAVSMLTKDFSTKEEQLKTEIMDLQNELQHVKIEQVLYLLNLF